MTAALHSAVLPDQYNLPLSIILVHLHHSIVKLDRLALPFHLPLRRPHNPQIRIVIQRTRRLCHPHAIILRKPALPAVDHRCLDDPRGLDADERGAVERRDAALHSFGLICNRHAGVGRRQHENCYLEPVARRDREVVQVLRRGLGNPLEPGEVGGFGCGVFDLRGCQGGEFKDWVGTYLAVRTGLQQGV